MLRSQWITVAVQMAPRTRAAMRMTASETISRTSIAQVWREVLSGSSRSVCRRASVLDRPHCDGQSLGLRKLPVRHRFRELRINCLEPSIPRSESHRRLLEIRERQSRMDLLACRGCGRYFALHTDENPDHGRCPDCGTEISLLAHSERGQPLRISLRQLVPRRTRPYLAADQNVDPSPGFLALP